MYVITYRHAARGRVTASWRASEVCDAAGVEDECPHEAADLAAHDQRRPTSGFDISTLRLSGPGRRLTDVGGLASEDDEVSERDTRLTAYSMGGVSLRGLGFLPPAYDLPPVDEQVELCATPSHRRRSSRV